MKSSEPVDNASLIEKGRMRISKWGVVTMGLMVTAFAAGFICEKLGYGTHPWMVPYIILQLAALVCGTVAAVRGTKWWLVLSFLSGLLIIQAVVALLLGD
jgi:RsiW-degrading membrane proteinase PrsW (M82 family)